MNPKFFLLILIVIVSTLFSCSNDEEIVLSEEKITDLNWEDKPKWHFRIYRIYPNDVNLDPYTCEAEGIAGNYEFDFSFSYSLDCHQRWEKISFTEPNDSIEWQPITAMLEHRVDINADTSQATIGKLKRNEWYRFDGLRKDIRYFIYLDSTGQGRNLTTELCPHGSGCNGAW